MLIENDLACKMNWTGLHGKTSFQGLEVRNVVTGRLDVHYITGTLDVPGNIFRLICQLCSLCLYVNKWHKRREILFVFQNNHVRVKGALVIIC